MKQFTLALFATLCIWLVLPNQAQAQEYEVGTTVFNIGVGFGGRGDLGFGSIGINASGEMGVKETGDFGVIGAGVYLGYRSGTYGVFLDDYKVSTFVIAPRATYHFTVIDVENLDVYAAVQFDLAFSNTKIPGLEDDKSFDFDPSLIAGARYYFNDNMAGFAEVGINGLTGLNLGISFRL